MPAQPSLNHHGRDGEEGGRAARLKKERASGEGEEVQQKRVTAEKCKKGTIEEAQHLGVGGSEEVVKDEGDADA